MPEYNALNGRELRAILLKEIADAFDQIHDFTSEAVTFPVVRWQFKLTLDCYPREPQTLIVQKEGERIAADVQPGEIGNTQRFELQGANAVGAEGMLAPDQAREQAGLPVPTLKTDKKLGVAHHEMVQKQPATDEEEWRPAGMRSAVIDRGPRLRGK